MSIKKRRSTNNQETVKNIYRRVFEDSFMSQQISEDEDEAGKLIKSLARLEEVADMEKKHPELGDLIDKIDSGKMKLNQAWKITKEYKKREQCLAQDPA